MLCNHTIREKYEVLMVTVVVRTEFYIVQVWMFTKIKPARSPRILIWGVEDISHQIDFPCLKGTYYLILSQKEDKSSESV